MRNGFQRNELEIMKQLRRIVILTYISILLTIHQYFIPSYNCIVKYHYEYINISFKSILLLTHIPHP